MKSKLNRIISITLSAIISITFLTGCEKAENTSEETTVSETTAATIPADLTEEEMAIWESMPDIVTMRVYNDYCSPPRKTQKNDTQNTKKSVFKSLNDI